MTYIPSAGQSGARKYTGSVATGYDAKRDESPKWKTEQAIIEAMIDQFDGTVLDVPVGTGRFIPAYERNNLKWLGVDLSADMLNEAAAKATKRPTLALGDVTRLGDLISPKSVDYAIMCRLTRWLNVLAWRVRLNEDQDQQTEEILGSFPTMAIAREWAKSRPDADHIGFTDQRIVALNQLQTATRKAIIFTARIAEHPYAYPMEEIEKALDGWKIAENIECAEPNYRIIRLEPAA